MRNISDKCRRENQNTQLLFNKLFFLLESRAVYEIMWKHCTAGQATDDNIARAHCMLGT